MASSNEKEQDEVAECKDEQSSNCSISTEPQELDESNSQNCDLPKADNEQSVTEIDCTSETTELPDKTISIDKVNDDINENLDVTSDVKNSSNLSDVQFLSQVNLLKKDTSQNNQSNVKPLNSLSESTQQECIDISTPVNDAPSFPKKRRRWKREIYDKSLDPESIKQQKKKRAVELKLKNLRWTLNQPGVSEDICGKRKKKAPERFELALLNKRRNTMDDLEGDGDFLADIPWIIQQVKVANIYILRLLHRVIFRKQGMFSEKHIRKSVLNFRGFPFGIDSAELQKRKYPLEKASPTSLSKLCDMLGIKGGSKEEMIENILTFLQRPNKDQVEEHIKEVMMSKLQKQNVVLNKTPTIPVFPAPQSTNVSPESNSSLLYEEDECIITGPWEKPQFFVEGTGIKLKYIKPIVTALQVVAESMIELLHRILFLNGDEKSHMRRNILEFSGFRCIVGSDDYILRTKLLAVLPLDQLKFICRVLGLPTWHRSRQLLIETIMDFLAAPRLSAMKKRVTPPLPNNVCPLSQASLSAATAEVKHLETEEIEIVPDIHISDEEEEEHQKEISVEIPNENKVKLKHFQNIFAQVMSTPAGKLNDLHMVLFLKPCPIATIRKNILEFSQFPFDELSSEYICRKALMEHMFLENIRRIASVLCLSDYIVHQSRDSIIQAVLRFLLKPSAIFTNTSLSSPEIVEPKTIDDGDKEKSEHSSLICIKQEKMDLLDHSPDILIKSETDASDTEKTEETVPIKKFKTEPVIPSSVKRISRKKSLPKIVDVQHSVCLNDTLQRNGESDEPLSVTKSKSISISSFDSRFESDDEDDLPLANFIGHPSDDQIKTLISKVMKEARLEELTMKQLVKIVFGTYPHFDLGYRKDFIKSVVRQILSQMDQPLGSVSTTVFTS